MAEFPLKICYTYATPAGIVEAPTVRVAPGDLLDVSLTNRRSYVPPGALPPPNTPPPHDPCAGSLAGSTAARPV